MNKIDYDFYGIPVNSKIGDIVIINYKRKIVATNKQGKLILIDNYFTRAF